MRIATFNLENLELPVAPRLAVLRPALVRLDADIVCLQEVNADHVAGSKERQLAALDEVLAGTRYATYHRAHTTRGGAGAADVHNLVTLSRQPITGVRQVRHDRAGDASGLEALREVLRPAGDHLVHAEHQDNRRRETVLSPERK